MEKIIKNKMWRNLALFDVIFTVFLLFFSYSLYVSITPKVYAPLSFLLILVTVIYIIRSFLLYKKEVAHTIKLSNNELSLIFCYPINKKNTIVINKNEIIDIDWGNWTPSYIILTNNRKIRLQGLSKDVYDWLIENCTAPTDMSPPSEE